MFKQVKSALFWYYLYKFRRRVILIVLLLLIALFANAIYADVVQYLTLKDRLEFLEIVVISKWLIILFNISFSIYLILTVFKKEKELINKKVIKTEKNSEEKTTNEKFTQREQEFLKKRKLRSKADILLEN